MHEKSNSPTLRPATPADREFLIEVYAAARADEMRRFNWDERTTAQFLRLQFDAREHGYRGAHPDAITQVILSGGGAVGSMIIAETGEGLRLLDIALLPGSRGLGTGRKLITDLINKASAMGYPMHLSVMRGNPAYSLYQRLGFVINERRRGLPRDGAPAWRRDITNARRLGFQFVFTPTSFFIQINGGRNRTGTL